MARSKGRTSPDDAGAGGGADVDFGTMMMAAFQAGQQSVGGSYQGMPNDSEIKKWLN